MYQVFKTLHHNNLYCEYWNSNYEVLKSIWPRFWCIRGYFAAQLDFSIISFISNLEFDAAVLAVAISTHVDEL